MLRWNALRTYARTLRRPCLAQSKVPRLYATVVAPRLVVRSLATSTPTPLDESVRDPPDALVTTSRRKRLKSGKEQRLLEELDKILARLETGLPPHLQIASDSDIARKLGSNEIVEVLTSAQALTSDIYDLDVFSYLANEKGRWDVTVWLVKCIVESFATSPPNADASSRMLCEWKNDTSLDQLTRGSVDTSHAGFLQQDASPQRYYASLEEATAIDKHDVSSHETSFRHRALAMIWRSLGNMTIGCADGEIKPEILEIIAFLHHHGYMPSSIYESKPSTDPTAIQQSPILNLLSSRILTSLSDAAWRAHEKLIVEEAKSRGGEFASLRPEIPGSVYKVRVAGLKPEVWLELILWSCLHGGWIAEGMEILQKLDRAQGVHQWRPLSWRSLVSEQPSDTRDWEKVEYLFNNWTISSMDIEEPPVPVSVRNTVSSEVVNAYVDASVSLTRLSPGEHGRSISQTVDFARRMQRFLARAGLSLGAGSWDAIVLRLFDLQGTAVYRPTLFDKVIGLCPTMGQELAASNTRKLPDYVFDGTAAVLGLFHRALYYRIKAADVEGALRLFASLQNRTDENKRQSVADFLRKQDVFADPEQASGTGLYTDNYASIDYPAFYVQIPPTVLGPFVELVTDAKAYDFGKWLLYSEEIDGPIISHHLYGHPSITPALIRFAAETGDKVLLSRLIKICASSGRGGEPAVPRKVLRSFLESQINLSRWNAAVKILQHMRDAFGHSWNVLTLCHLLRANLQHIRALDTGDEKAKEATTRARGIFRQLVRGTYDRPGERPDYMQEQIDNLLIVLSVVNGTWARFCVQTQAVEGYRVFNLPPKAFNLVLEGVVDAYGSQAGRRVIDIFWNRQVRTAQHHESDSDRRAVDPPFSSFGHTLPAHIRRQRTEIHIPEYPSRIVMYAGLHPDLMTIRIVLKQAIQDFMQGKNYSHKAATAQRAYVVLPDVPTTNADGLEDQDPSVDTSPAGMIVWAVRCLIRLGMALEDVEGELRQSLPKSKLEHILTKLPELLTPQGGQEIPNDDVGNDFEADGDGESVTS